MDTQQIMELLLAMREDMKAWREKMDAETEAIHARTKAKTDVKLEETHVEHEEPTSADMNACQETTVLWVIEMYYIYVHKIYTRCTSVQAQYSRYHTLCLVSSATTVVWSLTQSYDSSSHKFRDLIFLVSDLALSSDVNIRTFSILHDFCLLPA
jgi:hypothetical protein